MTHIFDFSRPRSLVVVSEHPHSLISVSFSVLTSQVRVAGVCTVWCKEVRV